MGSGTACSAAEVSEAPSPGVAEAPREEFVYIDDGSSRKQFEFDSVITEWLNSGSDHGDDPTPGEWHLYKDDLAEEYIVLGTSTDARIDLLEIVSYPEGLDRDGIPLSPRVVGLCGPGESVGCADIATNGSEITLPTRNWRQAVEDTEYFAIGGILLPDEAGADPQSFMALVRVDTH